MPLLACPVFMLAGVWRYLSVVAQVHAIFSKTSFLNLKGKIYSFMQILNGDFETMVDLFNSAKKQIMFSSPGISEIIAHAFIQIKEVNGIDIRVFLEFNENTFRQGFGEISAITLLRNNGIPFYSKEGLNVYFLIIDESGYFYFPKSLFIESEGTCIDLFEMTVRQVKELKLLFNSLSDDDPEFEQIVDSIGDDKVIEIASNINKVCEAESITLETCIKNDLPIKPNFGRKLEVYRAKFQFVELKFTGANLHTAKVKLPSKVLPFKDDDLKKAIEANLRLLENVSDMEFLDPLFEINQHLKYVRDKYMYHIKKRDKNIIIRDQKIEFEKELEKVRVKIEFLKTKIINDLQEEIQKSRVRIKNNLFDFLKDNPPKEFEGLKGEVLLYEIENATNMIIAAINFPQAKKMLSGLNLEWHYYDITWQDLNNSEVLDEMLKYELITKSEKAYFDEKAIGATDIK